MLSNEDLGVEKDSDDWHGRVSIVSSTFLDPDDGAFFDEYEDIFADKEIFADGVKGAGDEFRVDLDTFKGFDMKTFMAIWKEYVLFEYSKDHFDADANFDITKFYESDAYKYDYIGRFEYIGFAVSKINDDESEDDGENNSEEIYNDCESDDNKIFLDKIVNIRNVFPDNMRKIRFIKSSRSFDAVNEYIKDPEKFNTHDLFYKFSKKELFNIGDIILGFLRVENDIWILTTVKKVTKVLGISNGQNYEGEEIEELKPFFGRLKVFYHNKSQNLVRYYDGLCDEIVVHSILPEKFSG